MKQGTVSILVGIHSPMHWYYVAKAWRRLYGRWPEPWEALCIALHDIGHVGKNYLDNPDEKAGHWRLGAEVAGVLLGWRGFSLCAGHASTSGYPRSLLYRADKVSWSLNPDWLLRWQAFIEPKCRSGVGIEEHIRRFRSLVAANAEREEPVDTHDLYLKMQRERTLTAPVTPTR